MDTESIRGSKDLPLLKIIRRNFVQERIERIVSKSYYSQCGIPTSFFTPIVVIARTTGWTAHIFEQRSNNKLIRPISNYIGPQPRDYVSIDKRVIPQIKTFTS